MGFIEKFKQDRKSRVLYGLGLAGDPAGKLYILEFLISRISTDIKTLTALTAKHVRINKT